MFLLAAGFLSLIIFIIIEKRSKHPMMPLQLFSNKTFSGANLLTFFLYAALSCAMLFLTLNMVQVRATTNCRPDLRYSLHNFTDYYFKMVGWHWWINMGLVGFLFSGPAVVAIGYAITIFC